MGYTDFMIASTSLTQINHLETLQEKAVKYIDNDVHSCLNTDDLCILYCLQPVKLIWREHFLCLMYRQSKMTHRIDSIKGRCQNSLPLTTNFSQNITEPSKGISYPVGDLCRRLTKLTGPCAYTSHSNLIPPTDQKQVTNVSQHVFVILLWGILMSPLSNI